MEQALQQNPRIDLIRSRARFTDSTRLDAGDRAIEAEKIIVASGVLPNIPEIPGLADAGFLTNETIMDIDTLPGSLVIIGGGPEGMEFGQLFRRLGVKVVVLQRRDRVLPGEDEDISSQLEAILTEEGVDIRLRAVPTRVERLAGGRLAVHATVAGREERFEADRLLVATGRRPHGLSELGLDAAGVVGDPTPGSKWMRRFERQSQTYGLSATL